MIKTIDYKTNPQLQQNVIQTAFSNWQRHGDLLFPPQRKIYEGIANYINGLKVIEYGCGIGIGSIVLAQVTEKLLSTDILKKHIGYAESLYPHLDFLQADLVHDIFSVEYEVAVAVELIEHIEHDEVALRNLLSSSEVWMSTPNKLAPGMGENKPNNSFHVREYTPTELIKKMQPFLRDRVVTLYDPISFKPLGIETEVTPVVYYIK